MCYCMTEEKGKGIPCVGGRHAYGKELVPFPVESDFPHLLSAELNSIISRMLPMFDIL